MPKELQLKVNPEARQFYLSVVASLTTLLIVEVIRALKKKGEAP